MLVDTHAHLASPKYAENLDGVIRRSQKSGVKKIICVGSSLEDSKRAIEIARKYPGIVFASVGLHPHDTSPENQTPEAQLGRLSELAQTPEVVAIGECGLDFSPPPPDERERSRKEQLYLFKGQVRLALQLGKPLIIHSRKAFAETLGTMALFSSSPAVNPVPGPKTSGLRGVFHCYSAGKKGIAQVNKLGFLFGVDGNLTYDEGLQNVFKQIPLEKILLETDAPWLAPEPFREQTSEPAHVKITAEFLAELKERSFESISKTTTQNARRLFRLD